MNDHECSCGSGLTREPKFDARNIFLCYACEVCWPERIKAYRSDVLTDPNYWHDEPIDEDNPEAKEFAKLIGEFRHYCPDWDFLAIDETCPEFAACLCFRGETTDV